MSGRNRWRRRAAAIAIVIVTAGSGLLHHPAPAVDPANVEHVGRVGVGQGLWWDGGPTADRVHFWELCEVDAPCWHYDFDVADAGDRLRVAIDYFDRESRYVFRVRKPDGTSLPLQWDPREDSADVDNSNTLTGPTTLEVAIPSPAPGTYRLSVDGAEVADDTFRARAVLDGATTDRAPAATGRPARADAGDGVLLPNVRPIPPQNATLDASLDGRSQERLPSYGDIGVTQSCNDDEKLLEEAAHCLRFAAGAMNLGAGPLDITFSGVAATTALDRASAVPATQVLHHADGTTQERPAGSVYFHAPHKHVHYEGALVYELHRVVDERRGRTVRIGPGHKSGYCMVDYLIADWLAIDQQAYGEGTLSNCGSLQNLVVGSALYGPSGTDWQGRIGWSKGWGDVYPNWRQGQYVEFSQGIDRPGTYLIKTRFDPDDRLLESNENDNASYLVVHYDGTSVVDGERGFGDSPWDPHKDVVTDWAYR